MTPGSRAQERALLGGAIRRQRRELALTLVDLSARTGASVSLLSQVERGRMDPSLETLRNVAEALGTTPFRLLAGGGARYGLVRAGEGRTLPRTEADMVFELLSPNPDGAFEVARWVLEPGSATSAEPRGHAGEEANVILAGRIRLEIGDERIELGPGDCITFDAREPHRAVAISDEPAVCMDILAPPSF